MGGASGGAIVVNGEERPVPDGGSIAALLVEMEIEPGQTGVAVAVNGEVVPRPEWESKSLAAGDRVELVRAVQGG